MTSMVGDDSEVRIPRLLSTNDFLTMKQLISLLPDLAWNQVFRTATLARRVEIAIICQDGNYEFRMLAQREN